MLQAKHELRGDESSTLDLSAEEILGRKRRSAAELDLSSSPAQHQVGGYLLQSSSTGSIPASHAQVPANIWMVTNSNSQVMSGDPVWTFPGVNNSALYRGNMSSGLHFMNFPTPMALLPGQQLGSSGIGGGGGGGGANLNEGHLSMLAGLNPYRSMIGGSESQASGSQQSHHGGGNDDRHDSTSHHS